MLVTTLLGGGEEVGECLLFGQVFTDLVSGTFSAHVLRAHDTLVLAGLVYADVEVGLENLTEHSEAERIWDLSAIDPEEVVNAPDVGWKVAARRVSTTVVARYGWQRSNPGPRRLQPLRVDCVGRPASDFWLRLCVPDHCAHLLCRDVQCGHEKLAADGLSFAVLLRDGVSHCHAITLSSALGNDRDGLSKHTALLCDASGGVKLLKRRHANLIGDAGAFVFTAQARVRPHDFRMMHVAILAGKRLTTKASASTTALIVRCLTLTTRTADDAVLEANATGVSGAVRADGSVCYAA